MITPLHIGTVGGHPLRFFRTPLTDGRPDCPWHCVDDLHKCLGLNRDLRRLFLRKLKSAKWPAKTIAAADGVITIAPHFTAQGTIDAMTDEGVAPKSVHDEYDRAAVKAMTKIPKPPFPTQPMRWKGHPAMSEHANREQAVRTLREQLLDICADREETAVVALALFEALMVVITCSAPTPQAAKDTLKETLKRAESGVDAAWATYRRTEQ
jgi:hypothetical protein